MYNADIALVGLELYSSIIKGQSVLQGSKSF